SIRGQNLAFGLGRVADATEVLEGAAEHIADPDLRARLITERAMVAAINGDFEACRAASDSVLAEPATSDVSRAAAYVTLTIALGMTGDCDRMDAVVDEARAVAGRARDVLPFAVDQVAVMQTASAVNAGRLDEANELCRTAIARADRGNAMLTTWLSTSVMGHEMTGQLRDAEAAAETALPLFAAADPFGLEAQVRGLMTLTAGQMGRSLPEDFVDARKVPGAGARVSVWLHRGKAWSAAAAGDLERAVERALAGARAGLDDEHFAWAAFSLSDAVRFGAAERTLDMFEVVDGSKGAHLVQAMKDQATASASGDADQLTEIARRYAGMHAWLLAADTFAQASTAFDEIDRAEDAARSATLSMAAERHCQQPVTPALSARPSIVSAREIEVALDAADGLTSPEIAERRFISVRTVDNHLRAVYRKLSVSGRDELADLLRLS
ncbi:MAG: hypothetical protein HKN41_09705, partial [Ilumatobacter sp.]|nr:hypothetical protein [Ilumatobacter sp.]